MQLPREAVTGFDIASARGPIVPDTPAQLADRAAVCRLAQVYALGMDLRDEGMVRSVFSPDAVIHGLLGEASVDDYVTKLIAGTRAHRVTMHTISNQFAIVEGDEATVWSYCVAHGFDRRPERNGAAAGTAVRYEDQAIRTERGWLISQRLTTHLWTSPRPDRP